MRLPARRSALPRWLQRVAAVLGLAGLAGLVGAAPAQAAEAAEASPTAREQLEARVQAVRSALRAQAEAGPTDLLPDEANAPPAKRRVAWPNWGNWTNWNNWNNWPNWSNWGNWFNR